MSFLLLILSRFVPTEVLQESLTFLARSDLCAIQHVCCSLRDVIDHYLPIFPYHLPRRRFHLVASTESVDTPIFSRMRYDPGYSDYLQGSGREFVFPHVSLKSEEVPVTVPKYLVIHDFTLTYRSLTSTEQLSLQLGSVGALWAPYVKGYGEWDEEEMIFNKATSFRLQYSMHHEGKIELSGEALGYILSHLVGSYTVMLRVIDLPRVPGLRSLLDLEGIRRSSMLEIVVEGECHQKLSVQEVLDYALEVVGEEEELGILIGRRIFLGVNVLEHGNDDMAPLARGLKEVRVWGGGQQAQIFPTRFQRFMKMTRRQCFEIVIYWCRRAGARPNLPIDDNYTDIHNPVSGSSLVICLSKLQNLKHVTYYPVMVDQYGVQLSTVPFYTGSYEYPSMLNDDYE